MPDLLQDDFEEADDPPEGEAVMEIVAHHGSYEPVENEKLVSVDDGSHDAEVMVMVDDGSHDAEVDDVDKKFLDEDEMEMVANDVSHGEDDQLIVVDDDGSHDDGDDDEGLVECDPTGRYWRYAEVLGRGSTKTVYKGYDMVDCKEVAWNQVKPHISDSQEQATAILHEVQLLKGLNHKGVLKLFASWVDTGNNTMNFITELCFSSLLAYRMKHKHVSRKAVKSWARQILLGLAHLHAQNPPIIHRDLKCENIFVKSSSSTTLKIGDFGSSTVLDETRHMHALVGTPEFMAPEMFEEDYNELVDVYSFGMCMIELITRECPYSECKSIAQIYKNVTRGVKPKALFKIKDAQALHFINQCLLPASQRPSAMALLLDPFLKCMEFSQDLGVSIRVMKESISMPNLTRFSSKKNDLATPNLVASDTNGAPKTSAIKGKTVVGSLDLVGEKTTGMSGCVLEKSTRVLDCKSKSSFRVMGKVEDEHTLRLKLRIQASSKARDIVFPFDLRNDSPRSVAEEMVCALNYQESDVVTIADLISDEVAELSMNSQLVSATHVGILMGPGITSSLDSQQNDELSDPKPLDADVAVSTMQHDRLDEDGDGSNNTRAAQQHDWEPLSKKLKQLPCGIGIVLRPSSVQGLRRPLPLSVRTCG